LEFGVWSFYWGVKGGMWRTGCEKFFIIWKINPINRINSDFLATEIFASDGHRGMICGKNKRFPGRFLKIENICRVLK